MAKKKGKEPNKAAAKAAKKAKAAQKVERKEKKKTTKVKDEFDDDDQDLESILDKVSVCTRCLFSLSLAPACLICSRSVDSKRVGRSTQGYRRACRRPP